VTAQPKESFWRSLVGLILTLLWVGFASVAADVLVDKFLAPYKLYILIGLGVIFAAIIVRGIWKIFRADGPTRLDLK
jgi:hypothetical protein